LKLSRQPFCRRFARDHLRALAQRVEVAEGGDRIKVPAAPDAHSAGKRKCRAHLRNDVAEGMGLVSNLLHLMNILIICFHCKSERAPTAIRDAFNKDRWLH